MAILGIDLGTTNSLACVWRDNKSELIPNAFSSYLTPSIISFLENGDVLVGEAARQRLVTHPSVTFSEFKRFMGTSQVFEAYGKHYYAQDLSAMVIRKLVDDARIYLDEDIEEAVISVPAYFNDDQRWATKIAGQLAGIRVERIINEPSAAALSQHILSTQEDTLAIVVDFGGGTLDISVVDAFENMIEIRAISGDNHLGGSDFDEALLDAFLDKNQLDKKQIGKQELGLLKQEIEKAKKKLSTEKECEIQARLQGKTYQMALTSAGMTAICMPLLQRIRLPLERVMRDAGIMSEDIEQVILAGGSCRMPMVMQFLESILQRDVELIYEPDQAIAIGCGVVCGIKERKGAIRDVVLSDICPFTLGIEIFGDDDAYPTLSPIIERNSPLPCSVSKEFVYRTATGSIDLKILQGEHRKAEANHLLKTISMKLPKAERYKWINIRFTYDINGLLEVETNTLEEECTNRIVVQSKMNRMSQDEIQERLKELQEYKLMNQGREIYRHLIERGERLYFESTAEKRQHIADLLDVFESALNSHDTVQLQTAYKRVKKAFDDLEGFPSLLS